MRSRFREGSGLAKDFKEASGAGRKRSRRVASTPSRGGPRLVMDKHAHEAAADACDRLVDSEGRCNDDDCPVHAGPSGNS